MPDIEMTKITDRLLSVYNYAFIESMPYGFFKPNDAMYVGVRLVDKRYHCPKCNNSFVVKYRNDNDGITYFSKSRIGSQKKVYDKLGMDFPMDWELMEEPFTYQLQAVCSKCAAKYIATSDEEGQRIYNLCQKLHMEDELIAAKAKQFMTAALKKWLDGITESSYLLQFDLSTHDNLRDLVCAVILQDTKAIEDALQEYRDNTHPILFEARQLLKKATPAWKAMVARSSSLPDSMSDDEYHEYTVAFPADDTVGQDFYTARSIEKERVEMFLEQRRCASLEDVLLDVGFHEEWIDMVVDKGTALTK